MKDETHKITLSVLAEHVTEVICGPDLSLELVKSGTIAHLRSQLAVARKDTEHAAFWVKQLLESLPACRDWLNPDVEKNLRAVLVAAKRDQPQDR